MNTPPRPTPFANAALMSIGRAALAGVVTCCVTVGCASSADTPALQCGAARPRADWSAPTAGRLIPPKRVGTEVCAVAPRVSPRWLTIPSGIPANENPATPDVLRIFRREGTGWAHAQCVNAPDPQPSDGFGAAAAIDGDIVVVGAPARTVHGVTSAGAVFVLQHDGTAFRTVATLESPAPAVNACFGTHVEIDGDTIVIGECRGAYLEGGAANHGVYVFRKKGGRWAFEATIPTPEELTRAVYRPGAAHEFGIHFALEGNRLVVGALGKDAVYCYERSGDAWVFRQRVDGPTDPNDSKIGPGFGRTVDVAGDTMVVAALRAAGDAGTPDAGAAFVYRREADRWALESKLTAPGGATLDMFAHWVAIDGDTILAGAFRAADPATGAKEAGAAYVFQRTNAADASGNQWVMVRQLTPSASDAAKFAAYSVDLSGNTAVLSAGSEDGPATGFGAWVFEAPKRQ